MFFSTVFISTIALTLGVSAIPASPINSRYVQLRLYGEPGCSALNLGELGVYGDKVNSCQTFGSDTVRSVSFEANYVEGCTRKLVPSRFLCAFYIQFQALTNLQWPCTMMLPVT
jgi:hypothetical protein